MSTCHWKFQVVFQVVLPQKGERNMFFILYFVAAMVDAMFPSEK